MWASIGAVVFALVVFGFTAYQAKQARDSLNEAAANLQHMTHALANGDTPTAQRDLIDAQGATRTASNSLTGPVWWAASKAPWIGDDVSAVRTVASVADEATHDIGPALVEVSRSVSADTLRPRHGRINLDGLERAAPALITANADLNDALARVTALDTHSLMPQIASPIKDLEGKLTEAHRISAHAVLATKLLPPMLGADGRRTYLVMFQNNAEIRATGGLPGAFATLTADRGRISLHWQGDASVLGAYRKPVLPLRADELALFSSRLAVYAGDSTFTPDFPRAAQIAQEMWRQSTGQKVDGVLSTDPVALSYVLAGTGPVTVSGGQQLTAADAVQLILNQIYLDQPDLTAQNLFFAEAAKAVFSALSAGQGNPRAVLDGIVRGVEEHRTFVYSHHPSEETLLASTPLTGSLPTRPISAPQIGVYFNDGTGAKMDYYLRYEVKVVPESCAADGAQTMQVTVTMTSTAPADAASLPVSVIGPGYGARPGFIRTNAMLYAPSGGQIREPTIDGRRSISATLTHDGRRVTVQTIDLAPGQSHVLRFTVTSGAHQTDMPDVRITPGVPGGSAVQVGESACR